MSLTRRNIFAPKIIEQKDEMASDTGIDTKGLVKQAQRSGGIIAAWRMQRAASAHEVELVKHALEEMMNAQRELMTFRVALGFDLAKKRAMVSSMAHTDIIEREIVRLSNTVIDELSKEALEVSAEAAREEVRRIRDLQAAQLRGEITAARFEREKERIEKRTNDVALRADSIVERVIENLGERLDGALRTLKASRF